MKHMVAQQAASVHLPSSAIWYGKLGDLHHICILSIDHFLLKTVTMDRALMRLLEGGVRHRTWHTTSPTLKWYLGRVPLLQGVPGFIVRREGQPFIHIHSLQECGDLEGPDCTVKVNHLQITGRGQGGEMGEILVFVNLHSKQLTDVTKSLPEISPKD